MWRCSVTDCTLVSKSCATLSMKAKEVKDLNFFVLFYISCCCCCGGVAEMLWHFSLFRFLLKIDSFPLAFLFCTPNGREALLCNSLVLHTSNAITLDTLHCGGIHVVTRDYKSFLIEFNTL